MSDLVKIEGDHIVIHVPISAMKNGAGYAFDAAWGKHDLEVVDEALFAKDVVSELLREKENGDTLVHEMLDKACVRAVENGAEGVEEFPGFMTAAQPGEDGPNQ